MQMPKPLLCHGRSIYSPSATVSCRSQLWTMGLNPFTALFIKETMWLRAVCVKNTQDIHYQDIIGFTLMTDKKARIHKEELSLFKFCLWIGLAIKQDIYWPKLPSNSLQVHLLTILKQNTLTSFSGPRSGMADNKELHNFLNLDILSIQKSQLCYGTYCSNIQTPNIILFTALY